MWGEVRRELHPRGLEDKEVCEPPIKRVLKGLGGGSQERLGKGNGKVSKGDEEYRLNDIDARSGMMPPLKKGR